ncbi:DHA2 family efflux MFS transporter permease subunit [Actinomadura sp. LD22]|uniref:DHA2 family efflux MFS transporter permease subunit n=1 Tax=Actinomadura physcomitrii TaxID=2650748 RepID=A0A6I4M962_9ACTN|nr:MDR family MFS transporter [Actinomadura physcomitrii]MVZ99238.1 DHA2 family efflux MFS transporter permease subunit [Actinomadura physcomitrii]
MTAPTRAPAAAPADATGRLDPALLKTSFVLVLGPILALLDTTIVGVGLDAVARDFGAPVATLQWVSAGYLLAIAMVMPLAGWASDRFGARTTWMASIALFTAGSALCGLAWSAGSLIAFRVLQGVGGGLIQPVGQSIVVRAAGPKRLGRVIGLTVMPLTFAPVLGPVLGGLIVERLDWRWMFLVNVPLGLVTLLLAARYVPAFAGAGGSARRLDLRGLALLSPGLAAAVYGFSEVGDAGGLGAVRVWGSLAAGAVLLAGYGVHALRRRGTALIDLGLFARRGFAVATANSFLQGAALYSSMLLLPLYYQQVEHASALEAGLLLAPQALGTAVATFFASRLADRMAPRPLILTGIVLTLAGTVAFTQLGAGPAGWLLTLSLVVRGAGLGVVMAPGMATVYASVRPDETARAAGAVNTLNRVGGSLGTAVLAVVLQRSLDHHPPAAAYGATFWWAVGLSALTLVPALFYPSRIPKKESR